MSYLIQSDSFRSTKQHFFSSQVSKIYDKDQTESSLTKVEVKAKKKQYSFLLENQKSKLIESEFNTLFNALKKQEFEEQEKYWLWCYYCASLLELFYSEDAYQHSNNKALYSQYKEEIKNYLNKVKPTIAPAPSFIETMVNSFVEGFKTVIKAPLHLSQIRDYVSISNIYRIYWIFSRLSITSGLLLANSMQWIEQLDLLLGTHTDVDKIIAGFQAPALFFYCLSVGFFLARFVIDSILLIKHTFFPSELEAQNTTRWERFKYEFYKRHFRFINDLVWAAINFITNFNQITHISDPIALYITAGFLFFDVCMALYQMFWAREEHLIKKAQLEKEIAIYKGSQALTADVLLNIVVLEAQLKELNTSWEVQQSGFYFQAAAAALLMAGFTASFLLTSPVLVMGSYFICVIGVAMYLSGKAYSQYREKAQYLENHPEFDLYTPSQALKEYEIARREFIFTMTKNTIVPIVLITVFAIYWPAAIVLTAVYLGAEAIHAYCQHTAANNAKQLEEMKPQEEDENVMVFV